MSFLLIFRILLFFLMKFRKFYLLVLVLFCIDFILMEGIMLKVTPIFNIFEKSKSDTYSLIFDIHDW